MKHRIARRFGRSALRVLSPMLVTIMTVCWMAPSARAEPVVLTDLLRIRTVTAIDLARDGSFAILAIRSIDAGPDADRAFASEHPPKNRSHLFRLDLRRAEPELEQLTFGDRMDVDPQLSPDDELIAFVRPADGPEGRRPQIWVLPTSGGEARQVTSLERGATSPRWLASSSKLVVTSPVPLEELPSPPAWPLERPGLGWPDVLDGDGDEAEIGGSDEGRGASPTGSRRQIRRWLEANAADERPRVYGRLRFQSDRALAEPYAFEQLFTVNVDDPRREAKRITTDARDHRDVAVDPAGRWIYFAAPADPAIHPDRSKRDAVWRIPSDGGAPLPIVRLDDWTLRSPKPSRDGNLLAFTGQPIERRPFRNRELGLVTLRGDEASDPLWLTEELDLSVWTFTWRPTESALIFNTARAGAFPLMVMGPGLLAPSSLVERVGRQPVGVHEFDAAAGVLVYAATTAANPGTIRVKDARGDHLAVDLHPWVENKDLSTPQERWIERPDGTRVQYWLMPPTNRRAGARYPAVLQIHGGPIWMWGPGERTMWHEFQLMCSWGYAVVYANPRGSAGYGEAHAEAIFQNWSEGPVGDVLAALDHALLESWIDADRLAVTGGSYGGYLTVAALTRDQRFAAAVAQRGVYDLETFFGEASAFDMVEPHFGGFPWDPRTRPILERESPFTEAQRIRTPLLIMHADQDLTTGVSQSEMLYRALKQMGRPVEYVRYPEADHNLSRSGDPVLRMDRLARTIAFFERFIENPRPAPRIKARVDRPPVNGTEKGRGIPESAEESDGSGGKNPLDAGAPRGLEEEERRKEGRSSSRVPRGGGG